jgi:hypothetical protein
VEPYDYKDAEVDLRIALDGRQVFANSNQLSSPRRVAAILKRAAEAQGVDVDLKLAPNGVLIAHAARATAD